MKSARLLVAVSVLFMVAGYVGLIRLLNQSGDELRELQNQVDELRQDKRKLEQQIIRLRSEEGAARLELADAADELAAAKTERDDVYADLLRVEDFLEARGVDKQLLADVRARFLATEDGGPPEQRPQDPRSLSRAAATNFIRALPRGRPGVECAHGLTRAFPGSTWGPFVFQAAAIRLKPADGSVLDEAEAMLAELLPKHERQRGRQARFHRALTSGRMGELAAARAELVATSKQRGHLESAIGLFKKAILSSERNSAYWTRWYEGALDALNALALDAEGRLRRVTFACSERWRGRSWERHYKHCVGIQKSYAEEAEQRGDVQEAVHFACGAGAALQLVPQGALRRMDLEAKLEFYDQWCGRLRKER